MGNGRLAAAADVDQGHKLAVGAVQDPVVAAIGATASLGLLIGPVLHLMATLAPPTIWMESFNDKHGESEDGCISPYPSSHRQNSTKRTDWLRDHAPKSEHGIGSPASIRGVNCIDGHQNSSRLITQSDQAA
jgi:hypothetical protein